VLRIAGQLKYQDRELRIATMVLLSGSQKSICIDVSRVPSLCSPEIQFLAKMAQSARERGKQLRVRLSKGVRTMFKDLELDGLVEVEEVEISSATPGTPAIEAPPEKISLGLTPRRKPLEPPKA
jgi:anti-anti-sigma regulatory factor